MIFANEDIHPIDAFIVGKEVFVEGDADDTDAESSTTTRIWWRGRSSGRE